jgi:hypothetical protein
MGWGEDTLKALAAVRQGSGVVGKLSTVGFFAFGAMACAFIWMPKDFPQVYVSLAGIGIVALTFLIFVWLSQRFAANNPQLAGLESGDYVKWRELELQAAPGQTPALPTTNVEPPPLPSPQAPQEGNRS